MPTGTLLGPCHPKATSKKLSPCLELPETRGSCIQLGGLHLTYVHRIKKSARPLCQMSCVIRFSHQIFVFLWDLRDLCAFFVDIPWPMGFELADEIRTFFLLNPICEANEREDSCINVFMFFIIWEKNEWFNIIIWLLKPLLLLNIIQHYSTLLNIIKHY